MTYLERNLTNLSLRAQNRTLFFSGKPSVFISDNINCQVSLFCPSFATVSHPQVHRNQMIRGLPLHFLRQYLTTPDLTLGLKYFTTTVSHPGSISSDTTSLQGVSPQELSKPDGLTSRYEGERGKGREKEGGWGDTGSLIFQKIGKIILPRNKYLKKL